MRRYGVPAEILTDNGKFTGRFGPGTGEVLFDRICRENGIKHRLTAPRSPTTTGKIERWHRTLRQEFLTGKVFDDVAHAQAQLDDWVWTYNHDRPHESIGMVPPWERFRLAAATPATVVLEAAAPDTTTPAKPVGTRTIGRNGRIGFASVSYMVGRWLAGETVEVSCESRLLHVHHRGVLIVTHARRHPAAAEAKALRRGHKVPVPATPTPRPTATSASVTRKVDTSGSVCFAGSCYRVGNAFKRRQVQVAIVGDTVEISIGEKLIRTHPIKYDRTREHGALANPGGRPRRANAA